MIFCTIMKTLILRKEYFGGLLFNRKTGKIYKLNDEGYYISKLFLKKNSQKEIYTKYSKNFSYVAPEKIKYFLGYLKEAIK